MLHPNDSAKRAEIVAEVMTWLSTPYHHNARVKGAGVDCAMLPAEVFAAVGLIPRLDPEYSPQWMMHRDEEAYLQWVIPYTREITRDELQMGDMAMWKFGRTFSHSAIIIELPTIIHAMRRASAVVLGDIDRDEELTSRPVRYFSLFEA